MKVEVVVLGPPSLTVLSNPLIPTVPYSRRITGFVSLLWQSVILASS